MKTADTLQNLCLNKIVLEFSSFYQAYCAAEDSDLKLRFEFLKKRFSHHIMEKLSEECQFKTEYLDFFINTYLKILDTRWLEEWSWERISQKLAEIGPNVEDIFFSEEPWHEILCHLPNLKYVCFPHCTDKFLVYLSKFCSCIEILEIRNYIGVSDKGVEYVLKNIHNLQKIDCYLDVPKILYSMHNSNINAFEEFKPYNLTHLDFNYHVYHEGTFNDILTVCVFVCPHLKSLTCPIFEKRNLDLCSQLQELEELKLYCLDESSLELNELLTLSGKKLRSLKIYNFCISLSALAQNCPHLQLLQMTQVNLQHDANDSVPVFHNLEIIVFRNFILIEPVISQTVNCILASVPKLNQLYFQSCELVSSDIKTQILRCCEQCKLSIIDFSDTYVELALLMNILVTCSTLETLYLNGWDYEAVDECLTIADSLPNEPHVYCTIESVVSDYSDDYDDFMMTEYEKY